MSQIEENSNWCGSSTLPAHIIVKISWWTHESKLWTRVKSEKVWKRKSDFLTLFKTYLISAARVKVSPTSIKRLIHRFYWILDREIIVEHVKLTDKLEEPCYRRSSYLSQFFTTNYISLLHISFFSSDILNFTDVYFCFSTNSYSSWISSSVTKKIITVLSYIKLEQVFQRSINARNAKKLMSLNTSKVEMKPSIIESKSSSVGLSVESPTPIKKL
ncbi:hypothetical protein H5410_016071 [Solanum commersonii]|uniref:Uncharacterized protein n=1 Tax=Solanum commersonii TaxID=4109 RepID=A0A9J5ZWH8_SOLCO|nr:hypothetical protein H5410_016071 [Solanum commersonii]